MLRFILFPFDRSDYRIDQSKDAERDQNAAGSAECVYRDVKKCGRSAVNEFLVKFIRCGIEKADEQ